MVGIPESERAKVAHAAEASVSWAEPVFLDGRNPLEVIAEAQQYLHSVAFQMAERRRVEPSDDLMTNLVQAEVDGERLTDGEIAAFFVLLSVAGNDTTRQTTSHTLKALTDFPEQRAWLLEDFDGRIGGAIEEFVRLASPVMTFRRTAVADFELNGQHISMGYPSG
jgi:cytochrome P450